MLDKYVEKAVDIQFCFSSQSLWKTGIAAQAYLAHFSDESPHGFVKYPLDR